MTPRASPTAPTTTASAWFLLCELSRGEHVSPSGLSPQPPDRRALAFEDPLAELVPLEKPGVAVRRALDRAVDDMADAVAADQLARLGEVGGDVEGADVLAAAARVVVPLDLVTRPAEHGAAAGERR